MDEQKTLCGAIRIRAFPRDATMERQMFKAEKKITMSADIWLASFSLHAKFSCPVQFAIFVVLLLVARTL